MSRSSSIFDSSANQSVGDLVSTNNNDRKEEDGGTIARRRPATSQRSGAAEGVLSFDGDDDSDDNLGKSLNDQIKELYSYIDQFKPAEFGLDTRLKPFIPDLIPCIGDIDPFVKVSRPDLKPDQLGLTSLDEPSVANASDPAGERMKRATFFFFQPT